MEYWKAFNNEYYEMLKKAWDDPNIQGVVCVKKRGRSEDFGLRCFYMARSLASGGSVFIMSKTEDSNYLDRVVWWLDNITNIKVNVERRTKKNPPSPLEFEYDQFGEITAINVVEQEDMFVGWTLTPQETV